MKLIVFAIAAAAILPCAEPSRAQGIGDSPVDAIIGASIQNRCSHARYILH